MWSLTKANVGVPIHQGYLYACRAKEDSRSWPKGLHAKIDSESACISRQDLSKSGVLNLHNPNQRRIYHNSDRSTAHMSVSSKAQQLLHTIAPFKQRSDKLSFPLAVLAEAAHLASWRPASWSRRPGKTPGIIANSAPLLL